MIIDHICHAANYYSAHPLFKQAFEYAESAALETLATGRYPVAEGVFAIFSDGKGVSEAESIAEFECHNSFIDIQVIVSGTERFGWKSRQNCRYPKGDYDAIADVQLYDDRPDFFFELSPLQFAVFFPGDVHAPGIAVDKNSTRKLVLKIRK